MSLVAGVSFNAFIAGCLVLLRFPLATGLERILLGRGSHMGALCASFAYASIKKITKLKPDDFRVPFVYARVLLGFYRYSVPRGIYQRG